MNWLRVKEFLCRLKNNYRCLDKGHDGGVITVKVEIPYGTYLKEFREDAVKLVLESGLSAAKAADRLSMPKTTLERWINAAKRGKLDEIGKSQRPLSEWEAELARVKRELDIVKMERDILKKAAAYFAEESLYITG